MMTVSVRNLFTKLFTKNNQKNTQTNQETASQEQETEKRCKVGNYQKNPAMFGTKILLVVTTKQKNLYKTITNISSWAKSLKCQIIQLSQKINMWYRF